ncbi:uncharacterized protein NECHADRAFT_78357 [Fusarium vanettenii 77-13-4]|uniref:Uncharacterized protein n=1 Tax=Fusarium vanettenii (strain ATCC MYA-4622 / CBS 123669 / FGSC 9596 / NRRL 45880 / 77-13-4) TaxID=660122 RepID=C7ZFK7_FUSV7|nr:uncharacterized protein NECHADRAFT_78357 [Fusarium vanettenii 77-13-4]EEU37260.1 predicted protein [Fusarium vanettenii 77-13-4]
MATVLSPSTWIQVLPVRLQRLLGTQQPSSNSDQTSTPKNSTESTTDHDDEWEDWVIPTPECEEPVRFAPALTRKPTKEEILALKLPFEKLMARQRAIVANAQRDEVGDKEGKPSHGEEEDLFHLEGIHDGIRMPPHTPPDSDDIRRRGPFILTIDADRWLRQKKLGEKQIDGFWYF